MKLFLITLTICMNIICGLYDYEFEFLNEGIFSPCEKYPNNFVDKIADFSNVNFYETEDGSPVVNGYVIIKATVEKPLPFTVEILKKQRGVFQPTILNQSRNDTCTACFSKFEFWHSYLENTPDDQLTCPFVEGKRIDIDISEKKTMSFPIKTGEGEYKVELKAGSEHDDFFLCAEIFAIVHKV